ESLLNKYILDTILLQKALSEVSTGSSDFRQYMWKYLREGLIKYYLDKRSGRLDAIQSYRSAVESGGITEQDLKSVPDLKKLNDEDPVLAVRMLAAVKLRRRLAAAARMQQVEIGKIKSEVKVKIVGGALYANPE
ncbi:MAG: hypothetical protein KDK37_15725, partial [Leptospiraceae bacterium]|nr:hypothetical protein [Leptospiraceae bacterium]